MCSRIDITETMVLTKNLFGKWLMDALEDKGGRFTRVCQANDDDWKKNEFSNFTLEGLT